MEDCALADGSNLSVNVTQTAVGTWRVTFLNPGANAVPPPGAGAPKCTSQAECMLQSWDVCPSQRLVPASSGFPST